MKPPQIPHDLPSRQGLLEELPYRHGPRPITKGIAPHRQVTQRSAGETCQQLLRTLKQLSESYPKRVGYGTSSFEKHCDGIFSPPEYRAHDTKEGEICHVHDIDGSMHMAMHPADVKIVIERGWGERHQMAFDNWGWKSMFVPPEFTMVYAPRDEDELAVILRIIDAAAWWVSGEAMPEYSVSRPLVGMEQPRDLTV